MIRLIALIFFLLAISRFVNAGPPVNLSLTVKAGTAVAARFRYSFWETSSGQFVRFDLENLSPGLAGKPGHHFSGVHELDGNGEWESSRIDAGRISAKPIRIWRESGKILYQTGDDKSGLQQISSQGEVLPKFAFIAWLIRQSSPVPMREKSMRIFDEDSLKLKKITWLFLGNEGRGPNRVRVFEIKGDLRMVIRIDTKGRLRSIKDMDLGLKYENEGAL